MTPAVIKTPLMVLHAITLLVAGTVASGTESKAPDLKTGETVRHLTVPIGTSHISIKFDRYDQSPMALVAYEASEVIKSDLLFINSEVLPVVAQVTGCQVVVAQLSDTQLLSPESLNGIPLDC